VRVRNEIAVQPFLQVNWGNVIDIPLSDTAWERVSHLLRRDAKRRIGRPTRDPREVLNAILWVTTRNEKWHRLPAHFPPSQTCYIKWLQWRRVGLMAKILDELEIEGIGTAAVTEQCGEIFDRYLFGVARWCFV
jgi:Putative transposase of IS4/5 family (DUF4096)